MYFSFADFFRISQLVSRCKPMDFGGRIEGWLNVFDDTDAIVKHGNVQQIKVIHWKPQFCIISLEDQHLYHFNDEQSAEAIQHACGLPCFRLDKGDIYFFNEWDVTFNYNHPQDPAYENRSRPRRKSAPATSAHVTVMDAEGAPSKFGFIPKRMKTALKRTKSATKLDRKGGIIRIKEEEVFEQDMPFLPHKIKGSRSHESLLSDHGGMETSDMTVEDAQVKPLHSSVLGQEHCFQITSSMGSKYYTCRNSQRGKNGWKAYVTLCSQTEMRKTELIIHYKYQS
ncbi:ras/Rap GTPase-activating protein SynGAP-like [Saccoglossus kowalevskii]